MIVKITRWTVVPDGFSIIDHATALTSEIVGYHIPYRHLLLTSIP